MDSGSKTEHSSSYLADTFTALLLFLLIHCKPVILLLFSRVYVSAQWQSHVASYFNHRGFGEARNDEA
jgi:hypothetical protein